MHKKTKGKKIKKEKKKMKVRLLSVSNFIKYMLNMHGIQN